MLSKTTEKTNRNIAEELNVKYLISGTSRIYDNGDSVKYNKGAREVLSAYPDIIINDLYTFTLPHHEEWMQEPGNVHYNAIGFQAQGEEVARIINETL